MKFEARAPQQWKTDIRIIQEQCSSYWFIPSTCGNAGLSAHRSLTFYHRGNFVLVLHQRWSAVWQFQWNRFDCFCCVAICCCLLCASFAALVVRLFSWPVSLRFGYLFFGYFWILLDTYVLITFGYFWILLDTQFLDTVWSFWILWDDFWIRFGYFWIINFRFFWILVIFTFGYVLDTNYFLNSHQNLFFTFGYVLDTFCILTFKTWTGVIRIQNFGYVYSRVEYTFLLYLGFM